MRRLISGERRPKGAARRRFSPPNTRRTQINFPLSAFYSKSPHLCLFTEKIPHGMQILAYPRIEIPPTPFYNEKKTNRRRQHERDFCHRPPQSRHGFHRGGHVLCRPAQRLGRPAVCGGASGSCQRRDQPYAQAFRLRGAAVFAHGAHPGLRSGF